MGLWEFLRQWRPGRMLTGIVVSLLLHGLVLGLLIGVRPLDMHKMTAKRGEPLMIDLPPAEEKAVAGMPGAPTPPPTPPPPPKAVPEPPAPKAVAKAPPAPKTEAPRPAPPAARPAPAPEQVAVPTARSAEPSAPAAPSDSAPAPAPTPAPTPTPAPAPRIAETPLPPSSGASSEARQTPTPSPRDSGERQVASVPPQPQGTVFVPDLRALRRGTGGAGGGGQGRAGIEGEPIPLDSTNPKYSDYLDQVRRRIKAKWNFPCVKDETTRQCDYKTTDLLVEFGIAKDGHVPFVNVLRSSGYPIYDDYAVNAIKLAMPFPPIPDAFSKTGVPIHATFSYIVESSLTNLLR
ncbi:MAG TPA: TonB family protein [Methylomirabilota bacterium]|jgi:TonB family protein|nr:TonB family protein [Methylomirabilota bacterium]